MYNLLVGFPEGVAYANRVLEYTEDSLRQYVAPGGNIDLSRLLRLPTLVMPEVGQPDSTQVARVGHLEELAASGRNYTFRFVPNPGIAEFDLSFLQSIASRLAIDDYEFVRTHWAVKDVDLHRVLLGAAGAPDLAPRVFKFPTRTPVESDLVAVMMPFDKSFDATYTAIKAAADDAGMRCHRADDIWINNHIMDDVISLIWRARVIVSDLSNKNANVFYETGIAHTLGRDVVQIARSIDDVPFDLRSIRSVTYFPNGEGLAELRKTITERIKTLTGSR